MNFWQKTYQKLVEEQTSVLLLVVASIGSSPGRQGFKMLVTANDLLGSIGGGVMEYQLVSKAKELLNQDFEPFLKRQIHQGKIKDGSGMICSGEQTVLFFRLKKNHLETLQNIVSSKGVLNIRPDTFSFAVAKTLAEPYQWKLDQKTWLYQEQIQFRNKLYIFGAGHVGLALSKIAQYLDFEIHLFDNRAHLNTFEQNNFVQHKSCIDYSKSLDYVVINQEAYIVIMTNSFVEDALVLEQFLDKNPKYLGILGSKSKLNTLFSNFKNRGIPETQLAQVHAPIGLAIASKTPEEIAISILAEIIQVKNVKNL